MTSTDIIQGFMDLVFREKQQNKVFPNIYHGQWECDVLELTKSGYLYEYEVKISRADFKNDAKKASFKQSKYESILSGKRVNYFYYVVPEGLISTDEVPEFAGLIYAKEITIGLSIFGERKTHERLFYTTVKSAPKLSREKISERTLIKLLDSMYYRYHSQRRSIANKI